MRFERSASFSQKRNSSKRKVCYQFLSFNDFFLSFSTLSADMRPQGSIGSPASKRGKFSAFSLRGGRGGQRGQRGGPSLSFDKKGFRKRRNSSSSESESSSSTKSGRMKKKLGKNKNGPNFGDNPNMVPIGKFCLKGFLP